MKRAPILFLLLCTAAARSDCKSYAQCSETCGRKNQAACVELGTLLEDGKDGAPVDWLRALELYQRACDAGEKEGCYRLALRYQNGQELRAAELFTRGGELGSVTACTNIGFRHWVGKGVPQDDARAFEWYQKGCNRADPTGCDDLGLCHAYGRGVAPDPARAAQLCQRACELGLANGCNHAAALEKPDAGSNFAPKSTIAPAGKP